MLESAKILFTSDQIYDLMNAVTELEQSQTPEMVCYIRLSTMHRGLLTTTLSVSLVNECTKPMVV